MRKWYKYFLDPDGNGKKLLGIDESYEEHSMAMGGYDVSEAYNSKSDFFNKYFFGYHLGRFQCYDEFIRTHVNKEDNILSIASGRSANELYLIEKGYNNITCSDLDISNNMYLATVNLFPQFKFYRLNILESPAPETYDSILNLSMIYLFDKNKLRTFFQNVSQSLKSGGKLVLDSAGSPDNYMSYLIHDCLLKWESVYLLRAKRFITTQKLEGIVVKHHGFRFTDDDIISVANEFGFKLHNKKAYCFLIEFKRSYLLNTLIETIKTAKNIFNIVGKQVPYVRMFYFEKI
ncbi:MAG: class I SAM-dependent methyltransferase [Nitrospirae bacterium]|nr:class I SAM-dependent methyltransferase [Nitrospirota bacterium]